VKQKFFFLIGISFFLSFAASYSLQAQAPDASRFWISLDDRGFGPVIMEFGNATDATYCVDDGSNGTTDYKEYIFPQICSLDMCPYWGGVRTRGQNICHDDLVFRDYRSIPTDPVGRDTFKLNLGDSDVPDSAFILRWQEDDELRLRCDSMFFTYVDPTDTSHHKVDMFAQESLAIPGSTINLGAGFMYITIYKFGCNIVDAVGDGIDNLPKQVELNQNYPNPFNPTTTISYDLPNNLYVNLAVFDVLGREVARLVDEVQGPGSKSVTFDGSGLSAGIYFYTLQTAGHFQTRKFALVR